MESITAAIIKHGNIWNLQTNRDMETLYEPRHAQLTEGFRTTVKVEKNIKYGPFERNSLDVYFPTTTPTSPIPVIVFFHGGGFVAGNNDISPSMHGHLGNYFASNGCICVLATYRLIPEARYPSGAEDISLALKWAYNNAPLWGGDNKQITAIGQSAGGAHLASAIFTGKINDMKVSLAGAILLSAPLWYDLRQERRKSNMVSYHGTDSEEKILAKSGVAVFRDTFFGDLPSKMLLTLGEFDSNEIVDGNLMFVDAYRKKFSKLPILEVLRGHNHISYLLGIGLEEDRLGKRVLEFIAH